MQIKTHNLYPIYLCYLDSKKLSIGAKSLAQISESMFSEFLKKYEFSPGFKEKWDKVILSEQRDESIGIVLGEEYDLFFETLNEGVFVQFDRDKTIDKILDDEFEIMFSEDRDKTSKEKLDLDDDIFDF